MTVTIEAPPGADVSRETSQDRPLFVAPNADDKAPRRAESPRPIAHDPDAPYGYMTDPRTGEVRARKTAGRQSARKTPAPRKRPANRPRVAPKPATPSTDLEPVAPVGPPNHREQVGEVCGGVWMVTSSIPTPNPPGRRFLGINLRNLVVRLKVQGHVIGANRDQLAQHVGTMADRIPQVARGVEWLTDENGWGWMIPTLFGLVGFVGQSQAAWQSPIAELVPIAEQVDQQFAEVIKTQAALMQPAPAADVSRETSTEVV